MPHWPSSRPCASNLLPHPPHSKQQQQQLAHKNPNLKKGSLKLKKTQCLKRKLLAVGFLRELDMWPCFLMQSQIPQIKSLKLRCTKTWGFPWNSKSLLNPWWCWESTALSSHEEITIPHVRMSESNWIFALIFFQYLFQQPLLNE